MDKERDLSVHVARAIYLDILMELYNYRNQMTWYSPRRGYVQSYMRKLCKNEFFLVW